jgi:hypothetical protein
MLTHTSRYWRQTSSSEAWTILLHNNIVTEEIVCQNKYCQRRNGKNWNREVTHNIALYTLDIAARSNKIIRKFSLKQENTNKICVNFLLFNRHENAQFKSLGPYQYLLQKLKNSENAERSASKSYLRNYTCESEAPLGAQSDLKNKIQVAV